MSSFTIGYAILKGRKRQFMIKKLQTIIGRKNKKVGSVKWLVDIDLG